MLSSNYIFEIERLSTGTTRIINPYFDNDFRIVNQKYEEEIFYRKKLNGQINIIKEDFNYIYSIYNESQYSKYEKINLYIKILCGGSYELIYTGQFSPLIGDWDLDRCIYTPTIDTLDEYTCILNNMDSPFNLMEIASPYDYCERENEEAPYAQEFERVEIQTTYTGCTDCDITKCNGSTTVIETWSGSYGSNPPEWIDDWCVVSDNTSIRNLPILQYPPYVHACDVITTRVIEYQRTLQKFPCVNGQCEEKFGWNHLHDSSGNIIGCVGGECTYWQCHINTQYCYTTGRFLNDALTWMLTNTTPVDEVVVYRDPESSGNVDVPLAAGWNYYVAFNDRTSGLPISNDPNQHWGLQTAEPISAYSSYYTAPDDGACRIKICFDLLYGHRLNPMTVMIRIFTTIGAPPIPVRTITDTISFPNDITQTAHADYCYEPAPFLLNEGESFSITFAYGFSGLPQFDTYPETVNHGIRMYINFSPENPESSLFYDCNLEYQSIFFDNKPDRNDPFYLKTNGGSLNYVTGLPTRTNKIMYDHISNVQIPSPTNPATYYEITIKDLLDRLRIMFNVYWVIENNVFKLEHISYFESINGGLNLTNNYISDQKGLNVFKTTQNNIPRREKFYWGFQKIFTYDYNNNAADFWGDPIIYPDIVSSPTNIEQTVNQTITDIQYVKGAYDDGLLVDDVGLVFISVAHNPTANSNYTINVDSGYITGVPNSNVCLSWANLHYDYHRHGRYLQLGKMNNVDEVFISTKKIIEQDPITINACCNDIETKYLLRTRLSNVFYINSGSYKFAEIVSIDYSIYKNTITLKLIY